MNSKIYAQHFLKICLYLLAANCTSAYAQDYPQGFSQLLVASGINKPTNMAFAPDGRIFICEQAGKLRVVKNGKLLNRAFITLSVDSTNERGLLGVAFDPSFSTNNWVYLYYTRPGGHNNRIIRVQASGDTAIRSSRRTIIDLDPLSLATIHNGGTIKFGTDGKLYVGVGDNMQGSYSQNLDSYHGKLLRINADGSVPPGNPYTAGSAQRKRVWCYGLRNPYTFDIDRGTGKIFVNDVGQNTWEEIDDATVSDKNFGWPESEGYSGDPEYINPFYDYNHYGNAGKTGCAITGGTFLPANSNYPNEYKNNYFFMDLCGGWINRITYGDTVVRRNFASNIGSNCIAITSGPDGNLYFLSRQSQAVYKIVYSALSASAAADKKAEPLLKEGIHTIELADHRT